MSSIRVLKMAEAGNTGQPAIVGPVVVVVVVPPEVVLPEDVLPEVEPEVVPVEPVLPELPLVVPLLVDPLVLPVPDPLVVEPEPVVVVEPPVEFEPLGFLAAWVVAVPSVAEAVVVGVVESPPPPPHAASMVALSANAAANPIRRVADSLRGFAAVWRERKTAEA